MVRVFEVSVPLGATGKLSSKVYVKLLPCSPMTFLVQLRAPSVSSSIPPDHAKCPLWGEYPKANLDRHLRDPCSVGPAVYLVAPAFPGTRIPRRSVPRS